jgi:hypothetical protein
MNPFKAIGRGAKKVVTAPVTVVRNTKRLLTLRSEAEDVLIVAEEAEADPRLYRDPSWWSRLLTQAGELVEALPIAKEARVNLKKLQDIALKVTMTAGAIGGLAGYLADQGILQLLPQKWAATIGVISGGAATLAALLIKSPLLPKPAPPEAPKE